MKILKLDATGQPNEWLSQQDAIVYHAKGLVAWQLGEGPDDVLFRGGNNRLTGEMSRIVTAPIIAIKGKVYSKRAQKTPALTNRALFARDRHLCAYCGKTFKNEDDLTRDHIVPTSKQGPDKWMNVVTACEYCNHKKDDKLLEECGMQLLYVPYVPNWAEKLILAERKVLACQMDYLKAYIPEHSRVWLDIQLH